MYLIDGYNLLHSLRHSEDSFPRDFGVGRRKLVDLLAAYAERENARVTIYFDGSPGRRAGADLARPTVSIHYTLEGEADAAICSHVANAAHPKRLRIVSSDRAVASSCRNDGAQVIDSPTFARRLLSMERKHAIAVARAAEAKAKREWEAHLKQLREKMLGIGPKSEPEDPSKPKTPSGRMTAVTSAQPPVPRISDRWPRVEPKGVDDVQRPIRIASDAGGMDGMVKEMLDQVGSFEDVIKDALGSPFPNPSVHPAPNLPDYHRNRKKARAESARRRAVG